MTYTAMWYDSANRQLASANYGTNGGAVPTRPDTPPDSTDSVLVTFYYYGQYNDLFEILEPAGTDNRRIYDAQLRVVRLINNNVGGSTDPDANNTILTAYSPDGQIASLVAINPTTGDQFTTYSYGTSLASSGVSRSDLLASVTYPDGGVVSYQYNRQGQVTQMTDQNGTVHYYSYDQLGRQVADGVSLSRAPGSGIDDTVLQIARSYNIQGQLQNVTSYDAPSCGCATGNVVNDIQYQYNGFGQVIAEYQSHSGPVNPSSTPAVQYTYANGSDNTTRLTGITYPSGQVASYSYGPAGQDGDMLSRVEAISFDSAPSMESVSMVEYTYLGLKTFVQTEYPEPAVRNDLAFGTGGPISTPASITSVA